MIPSLEEHMKLCRAQGDVIRAENAEFMRQNFARHDSELAQAQTRKDEERARDLQPRMQQDQFAQQRHQMAQQQAHERRMREMDMRAMQNGWRR